MALSDICIVEHLQMYLISEYNKLHGSSSLKCFNNVGHPHGCLYTWL